MTDRLDQLWAGWRGEYVRATAAHAGTGAEGASDGDETDSCVLCRVMAALDSDSATQVVHRGALVEVLLNAFPYNNGHVLVLPKRHVACLEDLDQSEHDELWGCVTDAAAVIGREYQADGINVGVNQGQAAGAGIPDHLHVHVLPRWAGDTSFTTAVAGTRIVPETLDASGDRLRRAWVTKMGRYRGGDD